MSKIRNTISVIAFFLVTIIIAGLTFFYLEQSIITEKTPGYYFDPISMANQIFIATTLVALVSVFIIYFIRYIRLSTAGILVTTTLLIILVSSTFSILVKPELQILDVLYLDNSVHKIVLKLPFEQRLTGLLTLFVNFAFAFFILLVLPNQRHYKKLLHLLIYTVVIMAFLAITFSLVTEWDKYILIFQDGYKSSSKVPESFFGNRNPYASFLLNAQILLVFNYYLALKKKRRFLILFLQAPLILAIFFTFSKTNIVLSLLITLVVFFHHLRRMLKEKKYRRFVFELVLSIEIIIFFFVFRFLPGMQNSQVHNFLMKFIPDSIFDSGSRTLDARVKLWRYAFTLIVASPLTFFFGDGPHISRFFYFARMNQEINGVYAVGVGDYHNGFVEVFHTFGLVGFVLYVALIFASFVVILKRLRTNRNLAFFMVIALVVFLMRSQTESLVMLMFKSEGILASLTYVLPFLYLMRLSHRKGYSKEIELTKRAK